MLLKISSTKLCNDNLDCKDSLQMLLLKYTYRENK